MLIRKISCFFDRITHEIKMIRIKNILISSAIFLILGIFSWIIGGGSNRVVLLYMLPRSAVKIGFMYVLWGLSFIFSGIVFSGVLFGCEKYRRHLTYKTAVFIVLMQIFTFVIYPLFFGAIAPFITLIAILISILFCILAILSSIKIYSLWSMCLCLHLLWLLYNGYICLAFIFIN